MTPERWQQITGIASGAMDLEAGRRTAFLDKECGGDAELRQAVEDVLKEDRPSGGSIEAAIGAAAAAVRKGPAAESSEPMPGRTISRYKIVEKLGEGGMGVVYRAEDTKLRRTVALKFPTADNLSSEEERARFVREARAAAALNHPNICTVHEIDEAEGHTFIAMEFVEGQSVKDKVRARPLPLDEALEIAMQASEGLKAAHAKGIVHRDIKSANLMVNNEGQIKIMDFGLARLGNEKGITQTGTTLGTLLYMAPEQAEGQTVDQRGDIWSLGIVLYEMVSGQLPFEGDIEAAVLRSILYEEPEPLTSVQSKVPQALDEVIAKALAKDRNERYQDVGELLMDLRVVARQIAEESDTARPSRRPITKAKRDALARARRRRLTWALGIATAAAVLTIAGLAVRSFLPTTEAPLEPPRVVPLTSYPGVEGPPAFSPDGNQVAFTWNLLPGDLSPGKSGGLCNE